MADSIQNKKNQATYMRQIQQDKAAQKREIMNAQKEDIKSVRDYYTDQTKQLEAESAAAVNHIKAESRQIAQEQKAQRDERMQYEKDQKIAQREEMAQSRSQNANQASAPAQSVEKKNSTREKLQ